MGVAELRRLRQLDDENRRLKSLVADLTLDKQMLQDA
jgi:putative transposase